MARFLCGVGMVDGTPVVFTRPAGFVHVPAGLVHVREREAVDANAAAQAYAAELVAEGLVVFDDKGKPS